MALRHYFNAFDGQLVRGLDRRQLISIGLFNDVPSLRGCTLTGSGPNRHRLKSGGPGNRNWPCVSR